MRNIVIENMEFIKEKIDNIYIMFSTAKFGVNYKKELNEGKKNIEKLKEIFNLNDIYYVNQIHSNIIIDSTNRIIKGNEDGDAIVFKGKNVGVGVFTADCVPVIAYDAEKEVIAAIHSGWKGTYNDIVKNTIEYMEKQYKCSNINLIIGPHIGQCCYEVSEDLKEKFSDKFSLNVVSDRYLNLEKCIIEQLEYILPKENIKSLGLCTNCNTEIELHSYRKSKEQSGRLFSLIYLK